MTYYKTLDGIKSCYGGDYAYTVGEWTPEIAEVEACRSGYHICTADQLVSWLAADIYECEAEGVVDCDDKCIASRIKLTKRLETWNEKSARLFGVWCARQVQHLMTDKRSIDALDVAERYANGKATSEELAAADAAAWAAADAARAAAWAAAADAAWAAAGAARAAAWAAAADAARAARAAAGAAADAAWAAAGAAGAAWAAADAADAAGAAADAAGAAAADAAWAAGAAAAGAAWAAQTEKLKEVLGI